MRIDRYIAKSVLLTLRTRILKTISELLSVCDVTKERGITKKGLLADLLDREKQMTTYLGNGVCLPHARIKMKRPYMVAVGRYFLGVFTMASLMRRYSPIFLLLASKNARFLFSLASLARVFQDNGHMDRLRVATKITDFRKELKQVFAGEENKPRLRHNRFNNLILREAAKIANGANCTSVLVFADTFGGGVEVGKSFKAFKTVLIAHGTSDAVAEREEIDAVIPIRAYSNHRFSQLRSAVLIGLTRGIFPADRLCYWGLTEQPVR